MNYIVLLCIAPKLKTFLVKIKVYENSENSLTPYVVIVKKVRFSPELVFKAQKLVGATKLVSVDHITLWPKVRRFSSRASISSPWGPSIKDIGIFKGEGVSNFDISNIRR